MEMSALTFFSWVVISAEGWSFLEVEGVALVVDSAVVGPEGCPVVVGRLAGGSWPAGGVGSRWLGLAVAAIGQ